MRKVHVDEQKEFLAVVKSAVGALALPATTATEGAAKEGDSEAMDVCEVKKKLLVVVFCVVSVRLFLSFRNMRSRDVCLIFTGCICGR